ncbi:hypothetical protein F4861DRAFT_549988 [Xylaria intraflava]|nr:hypothetical protein F4861DRAFT_549988 [Xylaria intraflava]
MDQATASQAGTKPVKLQKRCQSLPVPPRDAGEIHPYVPGIVPQRSVSLTSGTKARDRRSLEADIRPLSGSPEIEAEAEIAETRGEPEEGIQGKNEGRTEDDTPANAIRARRARVEAEFKYFETSAALLEAAIADREGRYMGLRREFFRGDSARFWDRDTWAEFLELDELMDALRGELFAAQARMEERLALFYLLLDFGTVPDDDSWVLERGEEEEEDEEEEEGGVSVWSFRGEGIRGDGLEWKGVDYDLPPEGWDSGS